MAGRCPVLLSILRVLRVLRVMNVLLTDSHRQLVGVRSVILQFLPKLSVSRLRRLSDNAISRTEPGLFLGGLFTLYHHDPFNNSQTLFLDLSPSFLPY